MFKLWLLRIFVFPGWILSHTFSVLHLNSQNIFEAVLLRMQTGARRQQSSCLWAVRIVVAQVDSHSFFLLPALGDVFQ